MFASNSKKISCVCSYLRSGPNSIGRQQTNFKIFQSNSRCFSTTEKDSNTISPTSKSTDEKTDQNTNTKSIKPKKSMNQFLKQMETFTSSQPQVEQSHQPQSQHPIQSPKKAILKPTTEDAKQKNFFRKALNWNEENFYNESDLKKEMDRVFDICHGCRLCFNLCNSFPKLFELIDQTPNAEVHQIPSNSYSVYQNT